jgi:hypothetical protein
MLGSLHTSSCAGGLYQIYCASGWSSGKSRLSLLFWHLVLKTGFWRSAPQLAEMLRPSDLRPALLEGLPAMVACAPPKI